MTHPLGERLVHPNCDFAAIADDVKPGVELLWVAYLYFACTMAITPDTEPEIQTNETLARAHFREGAHYADRFDYTGLSFTDTDGIDYWLETIGLAPSALTGQWREDSFAIVNTPENRQKLVRWLLQRGDEHACTAALEVVRMYMSEFVTITLAGDRLIATLNR